MTTVDDKRRFTRAPIGIIVRVSNGDVSRHYYTRNISAGGVFLLAEQPMEEETEVSLEMYLPLVTSPVRASGEVVWKTRQDPAGFAVKFTSISESSRKLIEWVVKRYFGDRTT